MPRHEKPFAGPVGGGGPGKGGGGGGRTPAQIKGVAKRKETIKMKDIGGSAKRELKGINKMLRARSRFEGKLRRLRGERPTTSRR